MGILVSFSPTIYSYRKAIEREQRIHKETPVQKKSSSFQVLHFVSGIRSFGTIRSIHSFRKYSALAVVLVSALFVSFHNMELQRTERGALPFESSDEEEHTKPNAFRFASERYTEIASLPYVKAENLEKQTKEEELADILPIQRNDPGSHLSIQSLIATANAMEKDPDEGDGVKLYTVKEGDTLSSIAVQNNITVNTILWANTIDNEDSIAPGDEIFILPVAGLKHIIKDGETLEKIAEEYKADEEQIIAFNNLPANGTLESGTEIVIPGGEKELPKKETTSPLLERRTYVTTETGGGSQTVSKRHDKPNSFPYGYCTWYVAQNKYIPGEETPERGSTTPRPWDTKRGKPHKMDRLL